jgi:hypothetical protein
LGISIRDYRDAETEQGHNTMEWNLGISIRDYRDAKTEQGHNTITLY